jgi:hypothetical protein
MTITNAELERIANEADLFTDREVAAELLAWRSIVGRLLEDDGEDQLVVVSAAEASELLKAMGE